MNKLSKYYSESDKKLVDEITILYNNRDYILATEKISKRLESLTNCKTREDYFLKIELAGFLIDIGEEGKIKQAALDGLQIIENEKEEIKHIILESSIEYNLGNAKSTLFKIQREETGFQYFPKNIQYLIESKNHYWKSFKLSIDEMGTFTPQLVVNLANTLSCCGRIVESLQYYDEVLEKYPSFPKANASRAKELMRLKDISGVFTKNMIYQAQNGYKKASMTKEIPKWLIDTWKSESHKLKTSLLKLGFDISNIHQELEETRKEFESLSLYRQFCINKHLTLSEHSLYCNCIGARRDSLNICTPFQPFDSDFIPIMEKVLNRLKSEYSFARLLYFYSIDTNQNEITKYDSEVMFTELYDSEYLGTKSEMIRTSFRLCFGILDKIASAICFMFDLSDENESIYFESFWKPQKCKPKTKQKTRWDKINSIQNISLVALYTQATDLNSKTGEWYFFKSWRNALEHNQLSLLSENEIGGDIFNIYKSSPYMIYVDKNYFEDKSLQILQFTRSAIFNFVFLIRNEARKSKLKEGKAIKHTFTFKNDNVV
ncbi:MAG: LA2681 family HEPN domain-containing protein [Candidatus Neomarinimicrobiota bacterium]